MCRTRARKSGSAGVGLLPGTPSELWNGCHWCLATRQLSERSDWRIFRHPWDSQPLRLVPSERGQERTSSRGECFRLSQLRFEVKQLASPVAPWLFRIQPILSLPDIKLPESCGAVRRCTFDVHTACRTTDVVSKCRTCIALVSEPELLCVLTMQQCVYQ